MGEDCDPSSGGLGLVFDGSAKSRQLCTPHVDLTTAGSVRFSYKTGGNQSTNNSKPTCNSYFTNYTYPVVPRVFPDGRSKLLIGLYL